MSTATLHASYSPFLKGRGRRPRDFEIFRLEDSPPPFTANLICQSLKNKAPLGGLILYGIGQKKCWYRDQHEEFFFAETARTGPKAIGAYRLNALQSIPNTKGVPYLQQTVTGARYVETEIYGGDLPASLKPLIAGASEQQEELARVTKENWQSGSLLQANLPFNQFARGNFVETLMWVVTNQYVNRIRLLETEWAWLVSRSRRGLLVAFGSAGGDGANLYDWHPQDVGDSMGFFLSRSDTVRRES